MFQFRFGSLANPRPCIPKNRQAFGKYFVGEEKWNSALAKSKFANAKKWPQFATFDSGHIGLQDHGNVVSFRNIKVKDNNKK